ncbi:MAG: CvpA family protein [Phycisphaerae bacterium]|nr:CvpA family protein [Phycisphaerae bacterium]
MFLAIVAFLLIVGIALWQIRQGAFSAMITLILASLSAAIALHYYEPLAQSLFDSMDHNRHPMFIQAVSLMALFTVVQLVLRTVFDMTITSDVGFAMWPNRIIAGVLGLFVGMVQVGVLTIALQMLPVGQSVMGYVAYNDDLTRGTGLVPLHPDRFVLRMVGAFSGGSLADKNSWNARHPDFLKEQFARRNLGWDHPGKKEQDSKPGELRAKPKMLEAATLVRLADSSPLVESLPRSADLTRSDYTYYIARVEVASEAIDTEDKWIRLAGTQFELAAIDDDARKHFYPVAFLVLDSGNWRPVTMISSDEKDPGIARPVRLVVERDYSRLPAGSENHLAVDWVYVLPASAKPKSLTFRGVSTQGFAENATFETVSSPNKTGALETATSRR